MDKYVIGMDFGTLSGRAILVRVRDGREMASGEMNYPHAVMDKELPDGQKLPPDWALQHPQDYLDVLQSIVRQVMEKSGVDKADVIGIGSDFTASTVLPVKKDGTPLCLLPEFEHDVHAYVKLWKHHGGQKQATRMTEVAKARGEAWLPLFGGKVSSEWAFPKILQTLEEAPQVYAACDYWVEAADWLIWQLTGEMSADSSISGFKEQYRKGYGYPSEDYFAAVNPDFRYVIRDKMNYPIRTIGDAAGRLTEKMAAALGLTPGIAVAVTLSDSPCCMAAVGVEREGQMVLTLGTSGGQMLVGRQEAAVPGICGVVADGMLPGFYAYEAGQNCIGDHFAWLVKNMCPARCTQAAEDRGISVHQYLTEQAEKLRPGQSGLLALDWWNGNRSVLVDADLTGMILGMTLQTTCEEVFRALMEALAYGNRVIVENYERHGIAVDEVIATGGVARKNRLILQIFADVMNKPVYLSASRSGPALGGAMFAACAAGEQAGGYPDMTSAVRAMRPPIEAEYHPIPENVAIYEKLYQEYVRLHDYFGRGENDVMKRLKALRG